MTALSQADLDFWHRNGYVILRDAVPQANVDAVVSAIWDFMDMRPDDPDSWYEAPESEYGMVELSRAGMVELYQHQALWDNRQHPRIHAAFAQIWDTEELWVTIDRVNLNPPVRHDWDFQGFAHWDIDTSLRPLPFAVQGVLALVDVRAGEGGLQVAPGFHREFAEWVKTQPADRNPRHPDISGDELVGLEMQAGDLAIWNSLLPHGTSRNEGDFPRLAQYISMFPASQGDEAQRLERVESWRERLPRKGPAFPGDPRRWEVEHGETAKLTPLGEKLLGLRDW